MTNYNYFSPFDGPNPSNTSSTPPENWRLLSPEYILDILEQNIDASIRINRLAFGLTESTVVTAEKSFSSPIGSQETQLFNLIENHEHAEKLHEIYNEFDFLSGRLKENAQINGWIFGVADAAKNANMGLPIGELDDLVTQIYPFPHEPFSDLIKEFTNLAPEPANKLLSQIYKHVIAETQAIFAACFRVGYVHGYGVAEFHRAYIETGMVDHEPAD